MATPVKLPLVPGLVCQSPPVAAPRGQTLSFKNGYALNDPPVLSVSGVGLSREGSAAAAPQVLDQAPCAAARQTSEPAASNQPSWLVNDKKVLRFYGFFEETVPEGFTAPGLVGSGANERYRVRKLEVLLYLVDDTVEVSEPRVANSGIMQGTFLKRVRVPKKDGGFLDASDLRVGADISLFGHIVHLCAVDEFTRAFYAAKGTDQPSDVVIPESPLDVERARATAAAAHTAKSQSAAVLRGMQFLAHDGKVLRFDGLVREREEVSAVGVHFYLGDLSIEIKDKAGAGLLLHRQRLPVNSGSVGVSSVGSNPKETYVGFADLIVGATLPFLSRQLTLTDADPFTRAWYADTLGVAQPAALPPLVGPAVAPVHVVPPHNGYGAPEDALRNVGVLMPKVGRGERSHEKFMNLSSTVLRYTAEMGPADAAKPLHASDEGRKFVVSLFLEDDTISIFEPPVRGAPGGRFLDRIKVRKPGGGPEGPAFTVKDFRVGAGLVIHGRMFTLTSSDEFSKTFQAEHPEMWA